MQTIITAGERGLEWLKSRWEKRSVLTRVSFCGVLVLFVARRILWLYTTPQNRADIPRAVFVLDVYLAACWIELPFLAVLLCCVIREMWLHKKQNRPPMIEAGS